MSDNGLTIRKSDIDSLLAKISERKFAKYLIKAHIVKLRGIEDQEVFFDFPVSAIIGINGGGKTTVLGAAGLAYIGIEPRTFFSRGGTYDPNMKDWKIQYEYLNRPDEQHALPSTATYKSQKWDRKNVKRDVFFFGVTRTIPAIERKELRKCASGQFKVDADKISNFEDSVRINAGRILGKKLDGFRNIEIDDSGEIKFMQGSLDNGDAYSEFHFGAGESSIIRIVAAVEAAPQYALILVEEIENGLHPIAVEKLVEYLIDAAKRKSIQTIFTTHSNHALKLLPHKAIWSVSDGKLRQGKLDIESLRALTGKLEKQAAIFVEDAFAKVLVEAALRRLEDSLLEVCEVHAMEGDSIAIRTTQEHRKNPAIETNAFCILDGDSEHNEKSEEGIFKLQGGAPEIEVYGKVLEKWEIFGGRLTVALNKPPEIQDAVREQLEEVRNEVGDHHLLFVRAAERLGYLPTSTVEQAFCTLYAEIDEHNVAQIVKSLKAELLN